MQEITDYVPCVKKSVEVIFSLLSVIFLRTLF